MHELRCGRRCSQLLARACADTWRAIVLNHVICYSGVRVVLAAPHVMRSEIYPKGETDCTWFGATKVLPTTLCTWKAKMLFPLLLMSIDFCLHVGTSFFSSQYICDYKKKRTLKSSFAGVQKCDGAKHIENLKRPLSIGRWPSHWEFRIVRIVKFQCESNPVAIAIKKKFKISNIHSQLNITHGRTRRRFELSNDRV